MRTLIRISALLILLGASAELLAWSGPGHAAIAVMAYRELPNDVKAKYVEILKSHPKFQSWKEEFERERSGFPHDLDFGMFLFVRASTWPDEIRRSGNPFDHPNWHFVDYPLHPPAFTTGPRPEPEDDVLFGILKSMEVLSNPAADRESRAAHLSWVIHLIGDIHQPLHCASLFSDQFPPPEGDRGGNLFFVSGRTHALKLHSFWDGQLGSALKPDPRKALRDAIRLQAERPRGELDELETGGNPEAWSVESRDAAIRSAYQREARDSDGNVRLVPLRGSRDDRRAPPLPAGYSQTANEVAERRIALAGYRLADRLR